MNVNYRRIGERIQSLRELRGLSIAEMADQTNFTPKSLLLAENGTAIISLEFVLSICQVLDVTPNDILKGQFPDKDFTLAAREALIDDFIARIRELEAAASTSKTKINNTEQTIEEIGKMVDSKKRELQKEAPVPKSGKWRSTYFK